MSDFKVEKTNWFPTEVYSTKIDDSICDNILKDIEHDKNQWEKGLRYVDAKTTGWNGLKRYQVIRDLSDFISKKVLPEIGKTKQWKYNNWYAHEAWINFYEKKDKAHLHFHAIADYSAVLIVQPGKGNLVFAKTEDVQGLSKKFEEQINQRINEEKGTLILFPSWLYHAVEDCEIDRITVAFNFTNEENINAYQENK
tara:strand:- start:7 stop:597 length:591 start_codon:yes stop_codon:yes gene_type:complete